MLVPPPLDENNVLVRLAKCQFRDISKYTLGASDDEKFRKQFTKYNSDWDSFQGYGIFNPYWFYILRTENPNLRIILDTSFNTIDIVDLREIKKNKNSKIDRYPEYSDYSDEYKSHLLTKYREWYKIGLLPYPFDKITLHELTELASRIRLDETNHGHSKNIIVNEQHVTDKTDSPYYMLLSYIELIGRKIEEYHEIMFRNKLVGIKMPDATEYACKLINSLNEYIDNEIKKDNHEWYFYPGILGYVGAYSDNYIQFQSRDIVDLLLQDKGYECKYIDNKHVIKKVNIEHVDLSAIVRELTTLLRVTREELKSDRKNATDRPKDIFIQKWIPERKKKDIEQAKKEQEEHDAWIKKNRDAFLKACHMDEQGRILKQDKNPEK